MQPPYLTVLHNTLAIELVRDNGNKLSNYSLFRKMPKKRDEKSNRN
jgi:hypothetical protein